jgi:hypothetical protein
MQNDKDLSVLLCRAATGLLHKRSTSDFDTIKIIAVWAWWVPLTQYFIISITNSACQGMLLWQKKTMNRDNRCH